ncbi:hypothetical protein ACWDV4_05435 [Micromonospora sp. NPDC003197]
MSEAGEMRNSRRLVLRDGDDEESVEAFAATRLGWPRRHDYPEDRERWSPRQVTWYARPGIVLNYMEDMLSDTVYVTIRGTDPNVVRMTTELAEQALNTIRPSELLQAVQRAADPEDAAYAVLQAGIGSPTEFDNAFFTEITAAMKSDSPMVREAAIWATTYNPWWGAAYLEPLSRMANEESDQDLARTARNAAEEFLSAR